MKRKLSFLIVLLLLIIGGLGAWWVTAISPVDISDKSSKLFVVKPGDGVKEIAKNLKSENLISNPVAFFLIVKQLNLDSKIQAGDFRLSRSMNLQKIAESLTHGSLDIWVTFPEGVRAEEIADILEEKFSTFDESWRAQLAIHEGYLFPDTYLVPVDATVDDVISIMRSNFDNKYATLTGIRKNNYTKEELITIASMVEREARLDEDRPLVASVIFNRLEIGMALQIDATVQYALGYSFEEKKWWKKNLTLADLKFKSPYNTYANPGLPIAPIANPGLAVLTATLNAPDTNYLYYITDPNTGRNVYATTLEGHNANISKYGL